MMPHGNANSASTPRKWSLDYYIKEIRLKIEKLTNMLTSDAGIMFFFKN